MKKYLLLMITIAIIFATAFAVIGCSSKTKATVEISSSEFAQTPNIERTLELTQGSVLTVKLASNQTTGFQWTEQAQISNVTILEQKSHRYIKPTTNLAGAGGQEEWTFRVLKPGQTTVSMNYSRPWTGGEQNVNTFQLTVTVVIVP